MAVKTLSSLSLAKIWVFLEADTIAFEGLVFLEAEAGAFVVGLTFLGAEDKTSEGFVFLGAETKPSVSLVFLGTEPGAFEDLGRIWFFLGTEALNVVVDVVTLMVFVVVLTVVETSWPLLGWKIINYYLSTTTTEVYKLTHKEQPKRRVALVKTTDTVFIN